MDFNKTQKEKKGFEIPIDIIFQSMFIKSIFIMPTNANKSCVNKSVNENKQKLCHF